jgi:dihydroxyacetone kinase
MGGMSGAIYAIFFNALANSLSSNISFSSPPLSIVRLLSTCLSQALDELCRYTTARKGYKTLMDALIPFVETFANTLNFWQCSGNGQTGSGRNEEA